MCRERCVEPAGESPAPAKDALPQTLWVEGIEPGEAQIHLVFRTTAGRYICHDTAKVTVLRANIEHVGAVYLGTIRPTYGAEVGEEIYLQMPPADPLGSVPRAQEVLWAEIPGIEKVQNPEYDWDIVEGPGKPGVMEGSEAAHYLNEILKFFELPPVLEPNDQFAILSFDVPGRYKVQVAVKYKDGEGREHTIGSFPKVVNVFRLDLDIVRFLDDGEHVPEYAEENGSKGACLSLNRGPGHRRPILMRPFEPSSIATGQVKLVWSSTRIELYDGASKISSGQAYDVAALQNGKRLYVEATAVSSSKGEEKINIQYIPQGGTPMDCDKVCFTNFEVEIILRDGVGEEQYLSPVEENEQREYIRVLLLGGQDKLGPIVVVKDFVEVYGGSMEMLGQLWPEVLRESDFYEDEFYWRQDIRQYLWENTIGPEKNIGPDDPFLDWQDIKPSDTGKIYMHDAPRMQPRGIKTDITARRATWTVWCTFKYHDEPIGCSCEDTRLCRHPTSGYRACSTTDRNYGLRTTLRRTSSGPEIQDEWDDESCVDGNVFGTKVSRLNYDLNPPVVTSITPNSGKRGETTRIRELAGSVFVREPKVELIRGGSTVAGDIVLVLSKNVIDCEFNIPADAETGTWNVKVTNPAVDDDGDLVKEAPKSSNTDITFEVTD